VYARGYKPFKYLCLPFSSIEAIAEFIEVALQVLLANAMKRSKQVTFGIGGEYVDPSQNILYILGAQANPSIVLMPVLFDYSVSPPAIRLDRLALGHVLANNRVNGLFVHMLHDPHSGKTNGGLGG